MCHCFGLQTHLCPLTLISVTALQVTIFWGLGGGVGAIGGGALGQWLYNNVSKASMPLFTGITVASATLPMWWLTNANLITTPIFFTLLLAVIGGMLSSTAGPLNKAMLLNVNEPETRGVALAWQSMTDDLGKGLGPALVSALISALGRQVPRSDACLHGPTTMLTYLVNLLVRSLNRLLACMFEQAFTTYVLISYVVCMTTSSRLVIASAQNKVGTDL